MARLLGPKMGNVTGISIFFRESKTQPHPTALAVEPRLPNLLITSPVLNTNLALLLLFFTFGTEVFNLQFFAIKDCPEFFVIRIGEFFFIAI